ncbi:radical SAM protein [Spirochaeta isovalerica]|uniref:Putative pyruvate formate lyase activating enzyme n=1 Tax=Spirochaeta isovalerica TaxID=150 RepID=A0A841RFM0_9SPIO|nr:radical SAM protein [Spirochaeta isovalerica]MBB6481152.1 putative pyruvate formate lyase activating enzyme [Spirochaeta isovalerica]
MDYRNCRLCPRMCGVDRTAGIKGFCGQSDVLRIGTAALHFGEEPPLTGEGGSGTIFFSGCTMGCPFCQNWQISRGQIGAEISVDTLTDIMLELERRGAENINFVTGTHFLPSIVPAVKAAKKRGLSIPLLWNCSGYETEEAIDLLDTFIDIYLPDYKASEPHLTKRLYQAEDYPRIVEKALIRMASGRPLEFSEEGLMRRGVIIRHLVLPGELESSRKFLKWYAEELLEKALVSVMVQYSPVHIPGNKIKIPERYISHEEYERLLDWMDEYGIEEGFFQDLEQTNDWLPDFRNSVPFPSKQTRVIWSAVTKDFIDQ